MMWPRVVCARLQAMGGVRGACVMWCGHGCHGAQNMTDEELAEMIKFQHGYAASAKFMTVMNEMLDTIINKMT